MVAIREVIEGAHKPYGLFHSTCTPLEELKRRGLRANAREGLLLHNLIRRLSARLCKDLEMLSAKYPRTSQSAYPLELDLTEQLAIAPQHYSGVVLTLEASDARLVGQSTSEPERKARALVEVARKHRPDVLEALMRSDGQETQQALKLLSLGPREPQWLVKLIQVPDKAEGFFSLLPEPILETSSLVRWYGRAELRPEARAILFNGVIPFECLKVL